MNDELTIAVIAGLAVGIAFVLLFAFYFSTSNNIGTGITKDGSLRISILGLKEQYSIDEPLNFTLSIMGYGYFCSDPTAKILDADSRQLVYDIPELDVLVFCRPEPRDIDMTIRLEDIMFPYNPILIGESGHYTLVIEFQGIVVEKDFIIYDDVLSL